MTKRIFDCTVEELVNSITNNIMTMIREENTHLDNPKHELPERLNLKDAADFINKSVHTVYGYIANNKIKSHLIGRNRWFFTADLQAWVDNGGRTPKA